MRTYIAEHEKDNGIYVLSLAMPGVAKENIKIDVEDVFLVIRVSGNNPFNVQPFYFTYLSQIDEKRAEAELKDGVLKLTLPLKSKKSIAIK
jgi:HSP20 family molecular chaperone IbpA